MKEADTLNKDGLNVGAVSRLYYYVFHAVRALLLTKGLEPKTHEGALRLLSLHFVKPGLLDPEMSHSFARVMKYREEADYNPSYVSTDKDYLQFKYEATSLHNRVAQLLSKEDFI